MVNTPIVEYVSRHAEMEEESTEVFAACRHPVDVRFYKGVTEQARLNGLAEVAGEPCSFCMKDFNAGIKQDFA